jgi:hypothetical protein
LRRPRRRRWSTWSRRAHCADRPRRRPTAHRPRWPQSFWTCASSFTRIGAGSIRPARRIVPTCRHRRTPRCRGRWSFRPGRSQSKLSATVPIEGACCTCRPPSTHPLLQSAYPGPGRGLNQTLPSGTWSGSTGCGGDSLSSPRSSLRRDSSRSGPSGRRRRGQAVGRRPSSESLSWSSVGWRSASRRVVAAIERSGTRISRR